MAHFVPERKRARRLRLTRTRARRRRDEHLFRNHFDPTTGLTAVDCVCELADTYFAKRSAFGCGCRKRKKGNPKVACGMCKIGNRDRIIHWRQEARELRVASRLGRWEERAESPHRPGRKPGTKDFTIERRWVTSSGVPGAWARMPRRYRIERDRDNALEALRKNTWRHDSGQVRYEYRIA